MLSESPSHAILVAEDDPVVCRYLEVALQSQGYEAKTVHDGEEALSYVRNNRVSAILLDIMMPQKDGMQVLREVRGFAPELPVIMISANSSPLNVVEAMRNGAADFLGKPINQRQLGEAVSRALTAAEEDVGEPAAEPAGGSPQPSPIATRNPVMQRIQTLMDRIGWSEAPVLIQGETGVGKEVLARQLHARSPRANKPLLKLNCAALPSELVESELFGYEKGAFTGAFQRKIGIFEQANQGTILLDEIGDMDHRLQAKLLQVLQDHEFIRVGGRSTTRVDVRVIAATHRDLEQAIADGAFREDLYYRLNVIPLRLPPLRERKEDILSLAEVLLQKHAIPGCSISSLPGCLRDALIAYDWPGNIRELENLMRKLIVLGDPERLAGELLAKASRAVQVAPVQVPETREAPIELAVSGGTSLEQLDQAKQQAETAAILAALKSTHWNRKQAAVLLRIDYKALLYKMKKLGIEDKTASRKPAGEPDRPIRSVETSDFYLTASA